MARIWVGVHPTELDVSRVIRLHDDIHKLIEEAELTLDTETCAPIVKEWCTGRNLMALMYLHNLIVEDVFPGIQMKAHDTPLKVIPRLLVDAQQFRDELYEELSNENKTAPRHWPPSWVTIPERIADLQDLQKRWAMEGNRTQLQLTNERYGAYRGYGKGAKEGRSYAKDVQQWQVESFIRHRREFITLKSKTQSQTVVRDLRVILGVSNETTTQETQADV